MVSSDVGSAATHVIETTQYDQGSVFTFVAILRHFHIDSGDPDQMNQPSRCTSLDARANGKGSPPIGALAVLHFLHIASRPR